MRHRTKYRNPRTDLWIRLVLLLGCAAPFALAGCAGTINEVYYFKSSSEKPRSEQTGDTKSGASQQPAPIPNVFRLTVNGYVGFSSARYLSGWFDERAIDLFFNEILSTSENQSTRKIFDPSGAAYTSAQNPVVPFSVDGKQGTFVMLLSSQTRAITDSIGNIAQNQNLMSAITAALNKDEIRQGLRLQAQGPVSAMKRTATLKELEGQAALLTANDADANRRAIGEMLRTIAYVRGDVQAQQQRSVDKLVEYYSNAN